MRGEWKIKDSALRLLAADARALLADFDAVRVEWVPREENTAADALANSES
jgi:probable phosphoglycerate mutase